MTGIDKALLRQLLSITGAWEITDYQLDARKQRCDVWVGPQVERGWFGRPKKAPPARLQQHTWQHVALGPIRFFVHLSAPSGSELARLPWTGDNGMPFTHALAQQVFVMFNEGMSLPTICKMMGLTLNDVWRYRFAIDNGLVKSQSASVAAAATAATAAAATTQPAARPAPTARLAVAEESIGFGNVGLGGTLPHECAEIEVLVHSVFILGVRCLIHCSNHRFDCFALWIQLVGCSLKWNGAI